MSNLVYPTLPGLDYNVHRAPEWQGVVRTTPSQREYRTTDQLYPRRARTLQYEFLRSASAWAELQQLEGFFNRHRGHIESWLLDDPDDRQAVAQTFGVGDGATATWQLVRTWGGVVEPIRAVNGLPQIFKGGVVVPGVGVSVSDTGLVTFATAPAAGEVLTWSGLYYWRCRFRDNRLDFVKFLHQLWKIGKVDLIDCKA